MWNDPVGSRIAYKWNVVLSSLLGSWLRSGVFPVQPFPATLISIVFFPCYRMVMYLGDVTPALLVPSLEV